MSDQSGAHRIDFSIAIPPGYFLLGPGDFLDQGDLWFSFVEMKFESVDAFFFWLPCDNYIAVRSLTVLKEDELPLGLKR